MNIYRYNLDGNLYLLYANEGKNISNHLGGKVEMIAEPYGWVGAELRFKRFDISGFEKVAEI